MSTRLERLLLTVAIYETAGQPVPLDLEAAVAAEGGTLNPIPDNTEDPNG